MKLGHLQAVVYYLSIADETQVFFFFYSFCELKTCVSHFIQLCLFVEIYAYSHLTLLTHTDLLFQWFHLLREKSVLYLVCKILQSWRSDLLGRRISVTCKLLVSNSVHLLFGLLRSFFDAAYSKIRYGHSQILTFHDQVYYRGMRYQN